MNMKNIQMLFLVVESIIALAPWRMTKRQAGSAQIYSTDH
jgi:hypothetical protein